MIIFSFRSISCRRYFKKPLTDDKYIYIYIRFVKQTLCFLFNFYCAPHTHTGFLFIYIYIYISKYVWIFINQTIRVFKTAKTNKTLAVCSTINKFTLNHLKKYVNVSEKASFITTTSICRYVYVHTSDSLYSKAV